MKIVSKGLAVIFGFLLATGFFAASIAHAVQNEHESQGMQGTQSLQPGATGQIGEAGQTGQVREQKQAEAQYDPFLGLLHKLNMTEAQKAQVAGILKANEEQAKSIANELANAGVEVRKDFMNGTFNADHFNNWVNYEKQGTELRSKIMASILPKLTQEQQTTLQSMQNKMGSNITSEINSRFARLDDWISKHAGSESRESKANM